MKTIHTKTSQLCIWPSDLGTNPDGTPWHAVALGIPHAATCEGLAVVQVYMNLEEAKALAHEIGYLVGRMEQMMRDERKESA